MLAPERVAAVEVKPGWAEVTLASGRVLTAPLVVGARAMARRCARPPVSRRSAGTIPDRHARSSWSAATAGWPTSISSPAAQFAILPLTDDRASLVWTEKRDRADALKAASPEAFNSHLYRQFGDFLGAITVVGPVFTYPLSIAIAEKLCAPRIALLGDAAHGVHPIAGQGLDLGLKGAAALAEVIVEAARLGEDIGSELVLEHYAGWRRFDHQHPGCGHGRLRLAVLQRQPADPAGPGRGHVGGRPVSARPAASSCTRPAAR